MFDIHPPVVAMDDIFSAKAGKIQAERMRKADQQESLSSQGIPTTSYWPEVSFAIVLIYLKERLGIKHFHFPASIVEENKRGVLKKTLLQHLLEVTYLSWKRWKP